MSHCRFAFSRQPVSSPVVHRCTVTRPAPNVVRPLAKKRKFVVEDEVRRKHWRELWQETQTVEGHFALSRVDAVPEPARAASTDDEDDDDDGDDDEHGARKRSVYIDDEAEEAESDEDSDNENDDDLDSDPESGSHSD